MRDRTYIREILNAYFDEIEDLVSMSTWETRDHIGTILNELERLILDELAQRDAEIHHYKNYDLPF